MNTDYPTRAEVFLAALQAALGSKLKDSSDSFNDPYRERAIGLALVIAEETANEFEETYLKDG